MPLHPEQNQDAQELQKHLFELAQKTVVGSAEYRAYRQTGDELPDAYRSAAHDIAANPNSQLSDKDRSLVALTGELGVYMQGQHELNAAHEESSSDYSSRDRSIEHALKSEYVVPFNHLLKDFINQHPNQTLDAASKSLTQAYNYIFGRYDCLPHTLHRFSTAPTTKNALELITASLDGMRHEIAAETILTAADYIFEDGTKDDDLNGIDLRVYLEDGWTGVDIKASQSAVEQSRSKHKLSRAVWTGLDWSDFKGMNGKVAGGLSIPYETAEAVAPAFISNIYEMSEQNKRARARMSRKTGRKSADATNYR